MKVRIEFDLEVGNRDQSFIDDLIADWTYDMRVSRFLATGSWRCNYTIPEANL